MDWKNIDLNSAYERDQKIIDSYSFEALLLEVSCNLKEINKETVLKQFETSLQSKIDCAREVMQNNIDNIVKEAQRYRAIP